MGYQGKLRFMRTAGGLTHHNAVRKKITSVKVTRLVFLDDHGMLTDIAPESADWRAGGTKYVDKQGGAHWLAGGESYPASVTRATQLRIEIDLIVESADADPIECVVRGTPSLKAGASDGAESFTFETTAVLGGHPRQRVVLEAKAPLPDHVHRAADWTLSWEVEAAARTFDAGRTGVHQVYVTFATPDPGGRPVIDPFQRTFSAPLEDGVTHKRMDEAVRLTEDQSRKEMTKIDPDTKKPMDPNDPHAVVHVLNASIPGYTLEPDPLVEEECRHPRYFKQPRGVWAGGAWPLIQFRKHRAECQAIVRYVRAIIMQIGCPGEASFVVVYAHPDVDDGATALVDFVNPLDEDPTKYRYDPETNGPALYAGLRRNATRTRVIDGVSVTEQLQLADRPVEVGERIPEGQTLNNFEACIQFSQGERTRFYAGGIDYRFVSAQQVLEASFWGLVWHDASRTITEVVRSYRKKRSSS